MLSYPRRKRLRRQLVKFGEDFKDIRGHIRYPKVLTPLLQVNLGQKSLQQSARGSTGWERQMREPRRWRRENTQKQKENEADHAESEGYKKNLLSVKWRSGIMIRV